VCFAGRGVFARPRGRTRSFAPVPLLLTLCQETRWPCFFVNEEARRQALPGPHRRRWTRSRRLFTLWQKPTRATAAAGHYYHASLPSSSRSRRERSSLACARQEPVRVFRRSPRAGEKPRVRKPLTDVNSSRDRESGARRRPFDIASSYGLNSTLRCFTGRAIGLARGTRGLLWRRLRSQYQRGPRGVSSPCCLPPPDCPTRPRDAPGLEPEGAQARVDSWRAVGPCRAIGWRKRPGRPRASANAERGKEASASTRRTGRCVQRAPVREAAAFTGTHRCRRSPQLPRHESGVLHGLGPPDTQSDAAVHAGRGCSVTHVDFFLPPCPGEKKCDKGPPLQPHRHEGASQALTRRTVHFGPTDSHTRKEF
jgi:hypothetical protein